MYVALHIAASPHARSMSKTVYDTLFDRRLGSIETTELRRAFADDGYVALRSSLSPSGLAILRREDAELRRYARRRDF